MGLTATVTKGYKLDTVVVPPTFMVEMGLAEITRTTRTYKRGDRLEFASARDWVDHRALAKHAGGMIRLS